MKRSILSLVCLAGLFVSATAQGAFVVPDGATAPFDGWSRGDANSTYAEWDTFTNANAPGTNAPDVGESGVTGASLVQNGAFAILASSGNIYSFQGPTAFDVTLPGHGLGSGYNTRVVVQAQTLGNIPDLSTAQLTYNDGSGDVVLAPAYTDQESFTSGGFSGLLTTFGWDIANYNPTSTLFEFGAAGSSMSLDKLVVDTFAQTSAFGDYPVAVPEPSALLMVGLSSVALLGRKQR